MDCVIRPALDQDADAVSAVILRALRETNVADYTDAIIERISRSFGPHEVLQIIGKRKVFVATIEGRIVGTAGLDGSVVRTVFVAPDVQARGVGKLLMAEVERAARDGGVSVPSVPSSITAEAFYARLGFKAIRDTYHGDERTIIMERSLNQPS